MLLSMAASAPYPRLKDGETSVSTEITNKVYAAFNELSQRNTRQRRLIAEHLAELAQCGGDFTTDDLWQELRQLDSRIGRATVFRSVEKLVDMGLLNRIEFADGSHHYRICDASHHHHHLTCTQCHKVVEVDLCLPAEQLAEIGDQTNFAIEGHSLTIFGRCPNCRA